jgi:hypothetical protein
MNLRPGATLRSAYATPRGDSRNPEKKKQAENAAATSNFIPAFPLSFLVYRMMTKMRILLPLFLIVLAVVSHTVLSFRSAFPSKDVLVPSSWMKSYPRKDLDMVSTSSHSLNFCKMNSQSSLFLSRALTVAHECNMLQICENRSKGQSSTALSL